MNETTLRALVEDAIARHLPRNAPGAVTPGPAARHPSCERLTVPAGGEIDGPCLIEPAVPCTHCGYCQSLGH